MPSESSSLEWLEAADILMVRDSEIRAAGWPSAFSLIDLAYLQYPDTTANGFRSRIKQDDARGRLIEAMKASIATGVLKAETRRKEIKKAAFHVPQPLAGLGSVEWQSRDFDRQDEQRAARARYDAQPDVTVVTDEVVTREAFAAWGGLPDQKQSEHLRAWLDSGEGNASSRSASKPTGQDSPAVRLESILAQLEKRAAGLGEPFSVDNMPGSIRDFHELCRRLDPVFKHKLDSFKRYTKSGRCKWSLAAKANPSAEPLYRRLFPEAWAAPRAVSENRAKV